MLNIKKTMLTALVAAPLVTSGSMAFAQTVNVGAAANVGGMIVFVAQAKGFLRPMALMPRLFFGTRAAH